MFMDSCPLLLPFRWLPNGNKVLQKILKKKIEKEREGVLFVRDCEQRIIFDPASWVSNSNQVAAASITIKMDPTAYIA